MPPDLFEYLFNKWKLRELKYQRSNKRKYLHFDKFIQFHKNIQWFKSFFKNALVNVPKHGFYPLIKADIVTPRIKHEKDAKSGRKRAIKHNKIRPISYASHFDSFIYSWYSTVITHFYELKLDELQIDLCVLAYLEKGKSNIEFAHEVFEFVKKIGEHGTKCVALAFDLSSFFDGLDHDILKEKWCKILDLPGNRLPKDHFAVYESLTNYTFVKKENIEIFFPIPIGDGVRIDRLCTPKQFREVLDKGGLIEKNPFTNRIIDSKKFGAKCGIPQGSPLSACLSNIYLLDFDKKLDYEAKTRGALYRRYCDDLIIICSDADHEFFYRLISDSIKQYEVVVNETKTEITLFQSNEKGLLRGYSQNGKYKNLQYLGFEFNGQNVYIRSSSMSRYSRRMSSKVTQAVFDAHDEFFGQKDFIFRKKLLQRFSDRGSRNFISYAKRAYEEVMNSKTIKSQVKNSVEKVERLIDKKKKMVESELAKSGNIVKKKH